VKTPSFSELKTMVEYVSEELEKAQLQEVLSTEKGLVLGFYRFTKQPRMMYLVFDLDPVFPFFTLLEENPWVKYKKTKPTALFLTSHAKNQLFRDGALNEALGRVVIFRLGADGDVTTIEFRSVPKQVNLIVEHLKKSISWFPVKELPPHQPVEQEEEVRSLAFLTAQWKRLRLGDRSAKSSAGTATPYEKWVKSRERDLDKKTKALQAVQTQIEQFETEEWAEVGEYLKSYGIKNLKPEWSVYVNFEKSISENIQLCFDKAKAAKNKAVGARERLQSLKREIEAIKDMSVQRFESQLLQKQKDDGQKKNSRKVEGRLRKLPLGKDAVAYMGKSAADNMNLLRSSKPHDLWVHLKDYPSAHAIIHRQKTQNLADSELISVGKWLVEEGLSKSQTAMGGKYAVVAVECRHVKPIKGDKMGRVTYHNAREFLIAL
jgi:predicted ribosome quality control (RQC) complex YloA/Tae2 family protein